MLSHHWRLAVRLYRERRYGESESPLRSSQGQFEEQMKDRMFLKRPDLSRWTTTVAVRPTRPAAHFYEPEVDFRTAALERDVKRGIAAAGPAILLAYGWECIPDREVFGPYGNLAHLAPAAAHEFMRARQRSHRRQRELGEYLRALRFSFRNGDDGASLAVDRIAHSCERLLDEADRRFMGGVRAA